MLAVDISNYSDPLTPTAIAAMQAAGVGLVIVQSVDPPAGYPATNTRAQIQACIDAGMPVDAYIWLWFDNAATSENDIHAKLSLLDGLAIRRLWLDVEDTAALKYSVTQCEAMVRNSLTVCDAYGVASGLPTGVYTGRWFWGDPRYMGNTQAFADRTLWLSNYDDIADTLIGYIPFGGWLASGMKQYQGTGTMAGIGNVDMNVLSVVDAVSLEPVAPVDPVCDWGWQARKGEIIELFGELKTVADQIQSVGIGKAVSRSAIVKLSADVRARAVQGLGG